MEDLNFDVFDNEEQKKVIINLADSIKKTRQEEADMLGFDEDPVMKKDKANLAAMRKIWSRNGFIDSRSEQIKLDQLLDKDVEIRNKMKDNFSTDLPLLIPRVLSTMAREAIYPNLVLTPLLTRVNYSAGTRVSFPTFGAFAGSAVDLAEGEEYPSGNMELGGQTECIIGKSGIAIQVTEEQKRYSQFDIISMQVRGAGRALAQLKEKKVANLITSNATVLFDNDSSAYPSTTGRDAAGAYNGTVTLDDIFKAWSTMVNSGFVPNTLIMHPFAWKIFAEDGMQRLFGFRHGMPNMLWQMPKGQPGNAPSWGQTMLNQNTYVSNPENLATTFTNVPSLFPQNFNIIVSPYMPFNATTNLTDFVFCDVNELGIMVVDEEVTSDEWKDPSKDIMRMKFRERYGLAIMNDGRAVGVFKNIKIAKNYDFANRMVYTVSSLTNSLTGDANLTSDIIP